MRTFFATILLVAITSSAAAITNPPYSYGIVLVPAPQSGRAAAKVYRRDTREPDHIFLTFDALKEFCATLPAGANLKYVYPMKKDLPPASDKFIKSFDELHVFCASRGIQFHRSYPDW